MYLESPELALPPEDVHLLGMGSATRGKHDEPHTDRSEGGAVRTLDRFVHIDLGELPPNPSPPDMWQERAACFGIDPDVFFPTSEEEAGPALSHCNRCGIRELCLAWAVKNGERYGVWGGLTEQQRRRLTRYVA